MERRLHNRNESAMRREFWNHKQAESERAARIEKEMDSSLVNEWMVRFQSEKNRLATQLFS